MVQKQTVVKIRVKKHHEGGGKPHDPAIFDPARLAQSTMDDASLGREILNLFLVQLAQAEVQVMAAETAQDWKFLTHTLKGSAATVGAMALASLARRLEEQGLPQSLGQRQQAQQALTEAATAFRGLAGV
jgi:HPt (histidine-containing phosphotransfer) domain-containing protein